ncbi:NADP/FAD dependent oxidoreductase [Klebsormidium nitens]|uniref:NADPH-dependent diflavin oxidoreductase 1 n=1 Tax=Klebsormidium nitens TaxID=105231 RepID=A0A1Y1HUE0_KLENI|nr:NADP/FAD dependent oxidoreductase [Klebsormidium nitens]|eukprot:GAQ81743.1 NADP/FAD dependent oxidoreductase [Klebsormidium nitens]
MAEKLLILYASQTGNAQDVAERIAREASRRRYAPLVLSMDCCDPTLLAHSTTAIFVAATTGQGDPPDNMRAFWRFLLRKSLPPACLQHLRYAVFGLGDSGYQKYNITAKKLDRRLLDLGAQPLVPRGLGDDQHPSGYEAALDPWLANLWSALRHVVPLPPGASEPSESDALVLDPPKFKVTYVSRPARKAGERIPPEPLSEAPSNDAKAGLSLNSQNLGQPRVGLRENGEIENSERDATSIAAVGEAIGGAVRVLGPERDYQPSANGHSTERAADRIGNGNATVATASASGDELEENLHAIAVLDAATSASSGQEVKAGGGAGARLGYSQANPYLATMVANVRLTSPDNEQDVRHIELDLGASGMTYAPGDVINVMPENSPDVVRRFCERCGLDADAEVVIELRESGAVPDAGQTESDGRRIGRNGRQLGTDGREGELDGQQMGLEDQRHGSGGQRNGADGERNGADGQRNGPSSQQNVQHTNGDAQQSVSDNSLNYSYANIGPNPHADLKPNPVELGVDRGGVEGVEEVQKAAGAANGFDRNGMDRDGGNGFGPVRIGALVRAALDVASASPRRYFFEVLAHFATAEHEIERLQYFATAEGRDDLYRYNQRERRTVVEVMDDFPSANLPLEWILQVVPRLKARAFSISSSLLAHPRQAHVTVAVVRFQTPYKRTRVGLCSHWLASLEPHPSQPVRLPVWVSKGFLKLPPPNVPMVMVGPGTGCAPFRSFLEERTELERNGTPGAPCMFFFGCRREKGDFLYKDQWLSYARGEGVLSEARGGGLSVAFSRDQMLKVYVTHKIKDQGRKVWQLLQAGASIFVAGSANKMPADVATALEIVAQREGQMTQQKAAAWLKDLEKNRRYHVEAWS